MPKTMPTGTPPKSSRKPTEEQKAIITAAKKMGGKGVLVVEAGAGTGKTTTLTMLEESLKGNGQYTAFNSSLVKESSAKFRKAQCNTTHSLAFRAVGKKFAHRLGGNRVRSAVIAQMLEIQDMVINVTTAEGDKQRILSAGFLASQVMGAVRRFCQSDDAEITVDHFRYIDGVDFPQDGRRTYDNNQRIRERLLSHAQKAWQDLSNPDGRLPFSHDHYVKVWQLDKPIIAADYILLDEAQDTAEVMLDVIRQNVEAGTMVVLVGDSAQQIYEWRGAVNAMQSFTTATTLMLSQSFRFGEAVADLANRVLDCLEQKTPLRLKGLPSIPSKIDKLPEPKAILCRTNGTAIQHLLNALAANRKPFLVGGGSDVIAFVEAAKALQEGRSTSHPDLACFSGWKEVQEYVKTDEGEDLKLMVKLIDSFGCQAILNALNRMPEEKDADVVISTAHKSKGREWETVKLAADFPTLSKSSDPDLKLLYVAVTRAKLVLDVSECPFFTGKDALEIEPEPVELVKPAPSTPPAPQAFTWSKGKDGSWQVRGPSGNAGKAVEVVRKDGSKSTKTLGDVTWESNGTATYKIR